MGLTGSRPSRRPLVAIAAWALATGLVSATPPPASAGLSPTGFHVVDEAELRAAASDVSDGGTIFVDADITLDDCPTIAGIDDGDDVGDIDILVPGGAITLDGSGIDGQQQHSITQTCAGSRVLEVDATTTTLVSLRITGGDLHEPAPTGGSVDSVSGGGVATTLDAVLTDVTIEANSAIGADGRPGTEETVDGESGAWVFGGGLSVGGDVTLTRTTIADNQAQSGSGGDAAPGGDGGDGGNLLGGGVYVQGRIVAVDSTIVSNTARGGGGGRGGDETEGLDAGDGGSSGIGAGGGMVTFSSSTTPHVFSGSLVIADNALTGGEGGDGGSGEVGPGGDGGFSDLTTGGGVSLGVDPHSDFIGSGPGSFLIHRNRIESGVPGLGGIGADAGVDGVGGGVAGGGIAAFPSSSFLPAGQRASTADAASIRFSTPPSSTGAAVPAGTTSDAVFEFVDNTIIDESGAGGASLTLGAGLAVDGDTTVESAIFDGNTIETGPGTELPSGAGLGLYGSGSASVLQSYFVDNIVRTDAERSFGAAIGGVGDGSVPGALDLSVEQVVFRNNSVAPISGQAAATSGSAIGGDAPNSTAAITNSLLTTTTTDGGSLIEFEGTVDLEFSTLAGGGVDADTIDMTTTVVDPRDGGPACSTPATTIIESHITDASCGTPAQTAASLFVDADGGDFAPSLDSPLRDAAACGDVTVDVFGAPRPQGPTCDIGAVEAAPYIQPEREVRNARLFGFTPDRGRDFLADFGDVPSIPAFEVSGTYETLGGTGVQFDARGGASDLFHYAPGPAPDYLWRLDENSTLTSTPVSVSGTYDPVLGDFDGDGQTDIFWYAPGARPDYIWYFEVDGGHTSVQRNVNGTYQLHAGPALDTNGDGRSDLIFHTPGPGSDFLLTGNANRSFTSVQVDLGVGELLLGDYDGNGTTDAWLYNPGTTPDPLRRGRFDGTLGDPVDRPTRGDYLMIGGPGTDFDGDGTDDLLAYAPGPGADYFVFGSRTGAPFSTVRTNINGTYSIVTDADWSAGADAGTDLLFLQDGPDFLWSEIESDGTHADTRLGIPAARTVVTATS